MAGEETRAQVAMAGVQGMRAPSSDENRSRPRRASRAKRGAYARVAAARA